MIKATIQNSPYCTEITFPCTESELSKKLGELGINPEHLAPMAMVLEIEPYELSVLIDCDISLDALNYLGKRLDGMDAFEYKQYLAVLSCSEISEGWGLKNMINLTDNLARYTLIEDTSDLQKVGHTHLMNVHGAISIADANNNELLESEGRKLLESGNGIDTDYGKIFVNDEIPFSEYFNGTTLPPYLYNGSPVTVEIGYMGLTETVELPCEELTIKKAVCRVGADRVGDCKLEISTFTDLPNDLHDKVMAIEKSKNLFELNKLLKTVDFNVKKEQPVSVFNKEVTRQLRENDFAVSKDDDSLNVLTVDSYSVKVFENGSMRVPEDCPSDSYSQIKRIMKETYDFCSAYAKAAPLKIDGLSENYRCLAEFNSTVLAAKYNEEYGFEFVTWFRSSDGKSVTNGNYFSDYISAKENFAVRSCLISSNKLFDNAELTKLNNCVDFTLDNNDELGFDECEALKKLSEKISDILPEPQQTDDLNMSM